MTTKKTEVNSTTTNLNIYQKLQKVQAEIKELIRTEENKFQKYFFFNELQVLQLLKPLLDKYQLTLLLSDDISQPFLHEKEGKEHYVKYLKRLEIVDAEQPESKLSFNFWAGGQNTDLAKAKGSAETYAIKYFLTKFFLIPVQDEGDPDYGKIEKYEQKETKNKNFTESSLNEENTQQLIKLFQEKITKTDDKEKQANFLKEMNQQLMKQGIVGTTDFTNFRTRLNLLTSVSYQYLYNWLSKDKESDKK